MATEGADLEPGTPPDPFAHPPVHDAPQAPPGLHTVGAYVALIVLAGFVLYPIWMSVVRAISNPIAWATQGRPSYPIHVDFGAFQHAWDYAGLGPALVRSFVATVLITSAQLITSTLSAYAFAFLD